MTSRQDFKRKAPADASTKTKDKSWQIAVSVVLKTIVLVFFLGEAISLRSTTPSLRMNLIVFFTRVVKTN